MDFKNKYSSYCVKLSILKIFAVGNFRGSCCRLILKGVGSLRFAHFIKKDKRRKVAVAANIR
jgi:hypothetical protein